MYDRIAPERADQRAGDDQHRIVEREADARRRPARIAVQHRDHDRHVGAADRDDDQKAQQERERRHHDERQPIVAAEYAMKNQMPKPIIAMPIARLTSAGPEHHRRAAMRPDSLPNAITDPENVIAPMNVPMKSSSLLPGGDRNGQTERHRVVDRGDRDQHRRHADQRVERGDQLRHLRHLHAPRNDRADRAADGDPTRIIATFLVGE